MLPRFLLGHFRAMRTATVLIACSLSLGLLSCSDVVAQTVTVHVAREERPTVVGLAEQLEGFRVTKGSLLVTAGTDRKDRKDGTPAAAELHVAVRWVEPAKDAPKGFVPAKVHGTDPVRALGWVTMALAGEGAGNMVRVVHAVDAREASKARFTLVVEFPNPRTGLSKARQFRHVRLLVATALRDLGMLDALPTPWPEGLSAKGTIGLYDAEGVGGSGCENVERAVDETTLGHRLLPVCPEDIREGGLAGLAAVVFPGGSGGGIAKALEPAGVAAVRNFVGGGGGYVGICAGAYFAGSGLASYAALMPWKHTQPWTKGLAQLDVALTEDGKRILGAEFASFRTRYNNGPVYPDVLAQSEKAGSATKPLVLANFASPSTDKKGVVHEAMVGTPAIAADTFGKGRVLVISPHPESHAELNALVARAIGWTLGVDAGKVTAK
ncbi:MAG: hypothetical protein RL148_2525 [Planctomycetota bacterium]